MWGFLSPTAAKVGYRSLHSTLVQKKMLESVRGRKKEGEKVVNLHRCSPDHQDIRAISSMSSNESLLR